MAGQGRNDGGGGELCACLLRLPKVHTVGYALQQGEQGSKNKAILVRPATLSESGLRVKVLWYAVVVGRVQMMEGVGWLLHACMMNEREIQ